LGTGLTWRNLRKMGCLNNIKYVCGISATFVMWLESVVHNWLTELKQNAEPTKLAVGEIFHVMSTSTDERDGINGLDCSVPASSAPANITDFDVDTVCWSTSFIVFFFNF